MVMLWKFFALLHPMLVIAQQVLARQSKKVSLTLLFGKLSQQRKVFNPFQFLLVH
jgi:hypothetical protein